MKLLKFANFETELIRDGRYTRVIGIDEVGRGCWAGPVGVGVFIYTKDTIEMPGVNDSKQLSLKRREELYPHLKDLNSQVVFGSVEMINTFGIGKTIEKTISEVVEKFSDGRTFFIIDGQFKKDFGRDVKKVIRADSEYYSVAASSIIAKVERDNMMHQLHMTYPDYNFKSHKGYGTREHRLLLKQNGLSPIHRTSFTPIREILNQLEKTRTE
jgi:ribonuclease HII